jgi:hypothetical protein
MAMFIADLFEISLDTVQLVDQIQGYIGTPGFPLSCTFCASTNLRRAWAQQFKRSTPACAPKTL